MTNTQTLGAFQADTMKISEQFNCFFLLESVLKILVQMYMVNVILASFERSAEIGRYSLRLWCVLNGYASQLTDRNKRTVYFSWTQYFIMFFHCFMSNTKLPNKNLEEASLIDKIN